MLLGRFAGQQKHGLNVILSNKNLIQEMRILGPLLTFTQLDHHCTDIIKTMYFPSFHRNITIRSTGKKHVKRVK
jgi:propanediol utilization protein